MATYEQARKFVEQVTDDESVIDAFLDQYEWPREVTREDLSYDFLEFLYQ